MAEHPHLETLKTRHRNLDAEIQETARRPSCDDLEIASMKKEKLRVKEEIAQFAAEVA